MGMMRMVMVVMMMMQVVTITVVGRPRDRFVGVRHRIRHEGHHLTRFVVGERVRCHVLVTMRDHLMQSSKHTDPSTCSPSREFITDETNRKRCEIAPNLIQFSLYDITLITAFSIKSNNHSSDFFSFTSTIEKRFDLDRDSLGEDIREIQSFEMTVRIVMQSKVS